MSAHLSVRGLTAAYGGIRVLDGLDLDVPAGRLTAVVGPNGAGKTTLLRALSGLVPRGGDVSFDGAPLPASPAAIVARGLSHVPESRELFSGMTVRENLELGAWRAPRGERGARLERGRFGGRLQRSRSGAARFGRGFVVHEIGRASCRERVS